MRSIWKNEEHKAFFNLARTGLIVISIGHLLHHYFVDIPLGLAPIERWFAYRYSMVGIALGSAVLMSVLQKYYSNIQTRLPFLIWGLFQSRYQSMTMEWSDKVPYGFCVLVPCLIAIVARLSPGATGIYLSGCFLVGVQFWSPEKSDYMIVSAAVVGLAATVVFRSRMVSDVNYFLAVQENLETQSKLIQIQMSLNDQIKAFLPGVIYKRFLSMIKNVGVNPDQAMEEVLKLKKTPVACLYSDIRGYTQISKNSHDFLKNKVIPNIQKCTEIVEEAGGISRLVGDLVFSYFDEGPKQSILQAVYAGMRLYKFNDLEESREIQRHIIISFGEVFVGNIGGANHAREITVMGSAANVLSRIDAITKKENFRNKVTSNFMILTEDAARKLIETGIVLKPEAFSLVENKISIRDFEEVDKVFLLKMSEENLSLVENFLPNEVPNSDQERKSQINKEAV